DVKFRLVIPETQAQAGKRLRQHRVDIKLALILLNPQEIRDNQVQPNPRAARVKPPAALNRDFPVPKLFKIAVRFITVQKRGVGTGEIKIALPGEGVFYRLVDQNWVRRLDPREKAFRLAEFAHRLAVTQVGVNVEHADFAAEI